MFCRVIESILSIVFYAKYGRCDVHICLLMGSTLASMFVVVGYLGLYSLSDKTSYRKISKSWSRKIGCYNDRISLTFDRHLGNAAAEVRVKFQCDWKTTRASETHAQDVAVFTSEKEWPNPQEEQILFVVLFRERNLWKWLYISRKQLEGLDLVFFQNNFPLIILRHIC